jgi:hypothetical protein
MFAACHETVLVREGDRAFLLVYNTDKCAIKHTGGIQISPDKRHNLSKQFWKHNGKQQHDSAIQLLCAVLSD